MPITLINKGQEQTHIVVLSEIDSMVRPERFELPTLWFEAKCSIQLSYGRTLWRKFTAN